MWQRRNWGAKKGGKEIAFNWSHEPGSHWIAHPYMVSLPVLGLCVTSVPVTGLTHRLKDQNKPLRQIQTGGVFAVSTVHWFTHVSLLSRLREVWGCMGHLCVCTESLLLCVSSINGALHKKKSNSTHRFCCKSVISDPCSQRLFCCWKLKKKKKEIDSRIAMIVMKPPLKGRQFFPWGTLLFSQSPKGRRVGISSPLKSSDFSHRKKQSN